jgi:hypothetical protein
MHQNCIWWWNTTTIVCVFYMYLVVEWEQFSNSIQGSQINNLPFHLSFHTSSPMFKDCWPCFTYQNLVLPQCSFQYPCLQTQFKFLTKDFSFVWFYFIKIEYICVFIVVILYQFTFWGFNFSKCLSHNNIHYRVYNFFHVMSNQDYYIVVVDDVGIPKIL